MGTKDIETAIFFDDDRRYADLLNGYIFDGKQVIMEKQLYSQDTRETGKSQKDSWGVQKRKKIQRFRDGVKRVAIGTSFTIIALEHQDKIHRGMPVRPSSCMAVINFKMVSSPADFPSILLSSTQSRSPLHILIPPSSLRYLSLTICSCLVSVMAAIRS